MALMHTKIMKRIEEDMKKILALMLFAGIVFLSNAAYAKELYVATTLEDLASIAQFIGGDKIKVESLSHGYEDPHFVRPKPSYIVKLHRADLYIENGLDLETAWASSLVKSARNDNILPGNNGYLFAGQGVKVLEVPTGKIDRSMGDIHPFGNPHYTIDPENGKIIAKNIADKLSAMDPDNAQYYATNLARFNAEIDSKIAQWQAVLAPYKGTKIVTYHNTWAYFAERFGFDVIDHVEPKAGVPPSPEHLEKLMAEMKREKVKIIVVDTYYDRALPDKIAKETGAKVLFLPTYVGAIPQITSYISLIDYDVTQFANALK